MSNRICLIGYKFTHSKRIFPPLATLNAALNICNVRGWYRKMIRKINQTKVYRRHRGEGTVLRRHVAKTQKK